MSLERARSRVFLSVQDVFEQRKRGRERDSDLTVQNKRNWLTNSNAFQLSGRVFKKEEGLFCFAWGALSLFPSESS